MEPREVRWLALAGLCDLVANQKLEPKLPDFQVTGQPLSAMDDAFSIPITASVKWSGLKRSAWTPASFKAPAGMQRQLCLCVLVT